MSILDDFLGAVGSSVGRVVGYVLVGAILLGGAYMLYRHYAPGPETDPKDIPEVSPGLPPIFDGGSTIVRPDSAGDWVIEEVPGEFDATITIDLPTRDSTVDSAPEYVSIGLREGAEQFFPELPGKRELPLDAEVIGPYGEENFRIKAQPQPILSFDLQAEAGLSVSVEDAATGGILGVTGARLFGVRLGGFASLAPIRGEERTRFDVGAGPYASLRVYGPFGVGVGKDITSEPLTNLEGITFTITANVPLP